MKYKNMSDEAKEIKEGEAAVAVKNELPELRPGQTVRVHQQIKEIESTEEKGKAKTKERKRVQVFEGIIIAKKGGKGKGATITVRKVSDGVGVEKIFPLDLPTIVKIEPVKQAAVKRAKLYYLRNYNKKLKEVAL
jgi:large subunit ribosomal protein L19